MAQFGENWESAEAEANDLHESGFHRPMAPTFTRQQAKKRLEAPPVLYNRTQRDEDRERTKRHGSKATGLRRRNI